ncbi:uncharacterized protein LOC109795172 [Cajanus cajan]|uniref:uncharacterized protein LOC109795172 n=1 Tax=Cajanus cajan TaxID=3821 RepID=UPI00098D7C1F|nr:uncharacterized protein LOC109795172 [Cajanus cajan]
MPPPKRKSNQVKPPSSPVPAPMRVTRAAAKRAAEAADAEAPAAVKEKKAKKQKKGKENAAVVQSENKVLDASNNKTIVVEHCKQCNQFKMRANLVKEGLEKAGCGISVILNPEKPRRGCFEIRQEEGKKFITLLNMKRPFKPMRDLDMDKVISDIIDEMSKN